MRARNAPAPSAASVTRRIPRSSRSRACPVRVDSASLRPLSYIGGKRALAKQVISVLPKHRTYVEPFAGGAQVFFHKEPSRVEVLNDLDNEIVNFFRVCQQHYEELLRYFRFCLVSRKCDFV